MTSISSLGIKVYFVTVSSGKMSQFLKVSGGIGEDETKLQS